MFLLMSLLTSRWIIESICKISKSSIGVLTIIFYFKIVSKIYKELNYLQYDNYHKLVIPLNSSLT